MVFAQQGMKLFDVVIRPLKGGAAFHVRRGFHALQKVHIDHIKPPGFQLDFPAASPDRIRRNQAVFAAVNIQPPRIFALQPVNSAGEPFHLVRVAVSLLRLVMRNAADLRRHSRQYVRSGGFGTEVQHGKPGTQLFQSSATGKGGFPKPGTRPDHHHFAGVKLNF